LILGEISNMIQVERQLKVWVINWRFPDRHFECIWEIAHPAHGQYVWLLVVPKRDSVEVTIVTNSYHSYWDY